MVSKNAVSAMRGAALWAATFVSVVAVAWIGSAAYVSFTTTDYAYPRTGGATNLNATMWNKLIDNVADVGARTSAITASSGGYVGIGTSNPIWPLQINANGSTNGGGLTVNTFQWSSIQRFFRNNGTGSSSAPIVGGDNLGALNFSGYWTGKADPVFVGGDARAGIAVIATESWTGATNNGTAITFQTTANGSNGIVERMKIDQSGYVGIGTSSPIFKLDVNGSANAASQCIGGSCLSAWGGIVGGSYTTATSKCAAVNNPATWSTSCPSGFTAVASGRGLCDQSDPSMYVTYLCIKN